MTCPNCGKDTTFTEHYFAEEWLTCNLCGAKTDYDELDRLEKVQSENDDLPELHPDELQ